MKKKIGILTFYDGINYGAFFQAYSLLLVLKKYSNAEVEFINYKGFKHWFLEYLVFYHKIYKLNNLIANINKIHKFRRAQTNFLVGQKIFFKKQLKKIKYDYIFYGSDEIWNYMNPLLGYNPIYFGHYNNSNKISYAPSFGSVKNTEKLSSNIVKGLSSFKAISVRDKNSQKIIFNNLKIFTPIVLDPTLLIDKTIKPILPKDKNYILVYTTSLSSQFIDSIKNFATKTHKQLISVGYFYQWCDKSYVDIGPEEWLGFYKNADYVVTSMFHGTIYAIKNKKNFVSIISEYRKNKLTSFLRLIKLENRFLSDPQKLERVIIKKPNYKKAFEAIRVKRNESLDFIRKALKQ
jgi:hypothetical protein